MINQYNIIKTEAEGFIEPVTLLEVKEYVGIDYDDFDGLLTDLITSERETVEDYCALALVESSVSFDVETSKCNELVKLPYAVKVENLAIKTFEDVAVDDFKLRGNMLTIGDPGTYSVSYNVVPSVPKALKQAIKMLVTYRFSNRGDQEKQYGIPKDIQNKLEPFVEVWL